MQVEILEQAEQDLAEGHAFYDRQQVGLGDYFLDSMFAEIDSLVIYAGIHRVVLGLIGCSGGYSLTRCITTLSEIRLSFGRLLIVAAILHGS